MFSALNWEKFRVLSFNPNCCDVCSDVHLLTQDTIPPPPSVPVWGRTGLGGGRAAVMLEDVG
jgi:hypothetical protein